MRFNANSPATCHLPPLAAAGSLVRRRASHFDAGHIPDTGNHKQPPDPSPDGAPRRLIRLPVSGA